MTTQKPPSGSEGLPPVPVGLQRLLRLAAAKDEFLDALVEHREAAVEAAEVLLTTNERKILASIPEGQLRSMADQLPSDDDPVLNEKAALIAERALETLHLLPRPEEAVSFGGIRIDRVPNEEPPERPVEMSMTLGITPDMRGSSPARSPIAEKSRGFGTGRVVAAAAALALGGTAAAVATCTDACDGAPGVERSEESESSD